MIRMRERRLARYIAAMLLLNMYIMPACVAAGTTKAVPVRTCLVFPFEVTGSGAPESLAADLQSKIQAGLSMSGGFRAISFSENMPSVQRALLETTIKRDELKGPFGIEKEQADVALKIGKEAGVDCVLVGTIDASADTANNTGAVTITAELIDVKTGQQNTVGVTGASSSPDKGASPVVLINQAASDAASKLVTSLTPAGAVPTKTNGTASEKKSKRNKWLLVLLVAGAVAALASGNSNGSDDETPPPPP